jgi:hypothetical protein
MHLAAAPDNRCTKPTIKKSITTFALAAKKTQAKGTAVISIAPNPIDKLPG